MLARPMPLGPVNV